MLSLATSKFMGDNKECDDSGNILRCFTDCLRWKLQNIEDSSLVILGYQLLPLETSKLMGDHKEFNDSAIFWGVLLLVGLWKLQNILVDLSYQMLSLATSQNMQSFNHILMSFAL